MSAPIDALQRALTAEHAAVYGYGVAGARLSGSAVRAARAALDAHRSRRDRLRSLIVDLGAQPVAAAPAYRLPFAVSDAADAKRLAAHIESETAVAYGALAAAATGAERALAARSLQEAAVRAVTWGGKQVTFPGYPADSQPTPTGASPA
jgi:hypothetical protein